MTEFVYLHGFASSPASKKASLFTNRFNELGVSLSVPDLNGGDFENMTLTRQMNTLFHLMDQFKNKDVCIIGSSMGAYIAILAAQQKMNINAIYLMAPGFNFLGRWMLKLNLLYEDEASWDTLIPVFHYRYGETRLINTRLFKDARIWSRYKMKRELPTRIVHGKNDKVVPIEESRKFADAHPWCSLYELNTDHGLLGYIDLIVEDCIVFFKSLKFISV